VEYWLVAPPLRRHRTMSNEIKISPASLSAIEAFHDLPSSDFEAISQLLKAKNYQANQHMITLGENTRDVFFIISGTVRITTFTASGKEVSFRDMHAGQMFGELSAIDGQKRSTNVVALTESVVAGVHADVFFNLLSDYPQVNKFVLRQLTGLIRKLGDRIVEFSALSVKSRIHAELLRLARNNKLNDNAAEIIPAPTHQDIANRISTHREAVSREVSELNKKGIIKRNEGKLHIKDISKLEELLEK